MARLFLIRHGEPETAWGDAGDDPGLSPAGQAQAAAAAAALAAEGTLAVLSSPMRRCQETAAPYGDYLASAPERVVRFTRAKLPSFLDEVQIRNLQVGPETIDLVLYRHEDDVGISVIRRGESDVQVIAIK